MSAVHDQGTCQPSGTSWWFHCLVHSEPPFTPLLPTQSLVSLSELRDLPNFNFPAELESAFAVAIETMGPR